MRGHHELNPQKSLNIRQSDQFLTNHNLRGDSAGMVPQSSKSQKAHQLSFRQGQSADLTATSPQSSSKVGPKMGNYPIQRQTRNHEGNIKSFDLSSMANRVRESNSMSQKERFGESKESKLPPSSQYLRRDSLKKQQAEIQSLQQKRSQSKSKNSSDLSEVLTKLDKSRNQDKNGSIFSSLNGNKDRMEFKTESNINKQANLVKSINENERSTSSNAPSSQPIVPSTGGSFDHQSYQSRNENQMTGHAYYSSPEINKQLNPLKNFEEAKFASKTHGLIISYAANTHQGIQRNYNEDRVSIILNMTKPNSKKSMPNWPKCSYFAIYDGHGGSACADFLKDSLHQIIINQDCFPANPAQALTNGCLQAEQQFISMADQPTGHEKSGSCAIIVLIVETNTYIANVGDSRAIMSAEEGKKLFVLSRDHRPNEDTEKSRIVENGGKIYQTQTIQTIPATPGSSYSQQQMFLGPFRVLPGRLSVSRTFGDIEAKLEKYGGKQGVVIAQPEIASFQLQEDVHDFIILGCDGIFDRLSNLQVQDCAWKTIEQCKINQPNLSIHQLCGKIVDAILHNAAIEKSFDNLTIVLVAFKNFQNTYEKLFKKETTKSPSPNQQIIKIKEEDSNVQNSESKTSQLETNKKLLLERIINQKREAKLSSRGSSQTAHINKDKDTESDAGMNSQRRKSPFGTEKKRDEANESLPNLKQSFQGPPTTTHIQNSFAQIQSKRNVTRNKNILNTNSNNVYYNQNQDLKELQNSNIVSQKQNSRNRQLASFYNSEKINPDLDPTSLYLQRKTTSSKVVNQHNNLENNRQDSRTRSGNRKLKQTVISDQKKTISLIPQSGSFQMPKQNIPPILQSNFTPKHFSGNSITSNILPTYGYTPSQQNQPLLSGMEKDRYNENKTPLKSNIIQATQQELKKKLPNLKSQLSSSNGDNKLYSSSKK